MDNLTTVPDAVSGAAMTAPSSPSIPQVPKQPLQRIALSCSGGGYRAASFHLGAMSYLNRLPYGDQPLLENVKMISTVSGGTITGAVYALQKQENKTFEAIYHFMMGQLSKLDLVKMGLEKLNPNGHWDGPHKRKNLINAFAELYNQHFYSRKNAGRLRHDAQPPGSRCLQQHRIQQCYQLPVPQ